MLVSDVGYELAAIGHYVAMYVWATRGKQITFLYFHQYISFPLLIDVWGQSTYVFIFM